MSDSPRLSSAVYRWSWLIVVLFGLLIGVGMMLPKGTNPCLRWVGVGVLFWAAVFTFWPFALLARHGRSPANQPYYETTAVAEHSLYALVRHPQYLGYILLFAGFALLQQHGLSVLLAMGGIALLAVMTVQEETLCLRQFGEPYAVYCQRVPRFNVLWGTVQYLRRRLAKK
ncbi:MAG: isoprenylcysteine carboxylmethyltransferase family protein [Ardenticatenaceae bacterium]|nr:isoprenylcysteine carboxylmethyltransferase family protein [Anaerolineales bacterium]MCB8921799.1 isoprenylcysteine carboxylmethyltransferase family protein [Ardenticatenaceae bacterium]